MKLYLNHVAPAELHPGLDGAWENSHHADGAQHYNDRHQQLVHHFFVLLLQISVHSHCYGSPSHGANPEQK